jgi:4-hydroxy-3-methylbut-2-en-1-yl diphosphate reductase
VTLDVVNDLMEAVKRLRCLRIKIDVAREIDMSWFAPDVRTVGICGATSTPKWLMEQCRERIEKG